MRQTPTTGISDFGSAPAVSPDQSTLVAGPAATASTGAARQSVSRAIVGASLVGLGLMDRLLLEQERMPRRPATAPPCEQNQQRQNAEEKRQCDPSVSREWVARVTATRIRTRR